MIAPVLHIAVAVTLVLALQHRECQQAGRATRWATYCLLTLAALLHLYLSLAPAVLHGATILEWLLAPTNLLR